jgi:cyclophilin family peptidyl-prolyl cis-trans isomerase
MDNAMKLTVRAGVMLALVVACSLLVLAQAQPPAKPARPKPATPRAGTAKPPTAKTAPSATPTQGAGPTVVVETSKGTFEFETYPNEAPRTVEHVLNLVKKNFYNGLRFHRVEPGFVIQVGDPNTRDYTKRDLWGTGGSGTPVGVAELSRKHSHVKGAVAMAHPGNAAKADAQFYVTLAPKPNLDGKYVVFGNLVSGFDVPDKIRVGDVIRKMYVKP